MSQAFLLAAKVQRVIDSLNLAPADRAAIEDVLDEHTPTPVREEVPA